MGSDLNGTHTPGSKSSHGKSDGTANAGHVRAIALVGPAGTGKTSLAESLLHAAGAIPRKGSVEAGTSAGDASPEARARHGSTEGNVLHFDYLGTPFALIDLPGAAGFSADGLAALAAMDMAIVVVDPERAALAGPILRRLDALGLPHAIFINRIDSARAASVRDVLAALQPLSHEPQTLREFPIREGETVTGYVDVALERAFRYQPGHPSQAMPIPEPLALRERTERQALLETLADFDDALMETLLMDGEPDAEVVLADLAIDTATNRVVPVLFGSALQDSGIRRLLKLVRHECPSPHAAAARLLVDGEAESGALYVFKVSNSGAIGRLAIGRVLGTALHEGDVIGGIRAGSLFAVQGDKTVKIGEARPGEVLAVARLEDVHCGALLPHSGEARQIDLDLPRRNAALAIAPRDRKDDVRLSTALHKLCEDDPALVWTRDDENHATVLSGINDEHLAIALARLARRSGVAFDTAPPRVAYRETIRKVASARGRHKKQSGGHGQYGDCVIELRPLAPGAGFRFEERITGGAIPKQWIPAVEAGVRDAMACGPLGFPVIDVAVTLLDGSFHAVDSSELAFRLAGRLAMGHALAQAGSALLEPVMRVTVDTPAGTGSKAGSVLSARRGQILGLEPHPEWAGWERVEAMLPQAALQGLDAELRSLSQGLASFAAQDDHLSELTGRHADNVIKAQAKLAA